MEQLHVAMFPWFAYGHINPFIQLSNKLISHGIKVSFFSIPGNIPRIKSSLTNYNNLLQIIPLSIPPNVGLHPDFDSSSEITFQTSMLLAIALEQMQPQIKTLLSIHKPHIVLFDFAFSWLPSLASELGLKSMFFSVFSAISFAYVANPQRRITDPETTIEDLKNPPSGFPNTKASVTTTYCRTFEAQDLSYVFKRINGAPSIFDKYMKFLPACDAVIFKSCPELEGAYFDSLRIQLKKPVLLAGPGVPSPVASTSDVIDQKWANWLQQLKEHSAIFCNFGSETYLDSNQIEQLTLGLELTGLPFFLVLNFSNSNSQAQLEAALPEGFLDRVKDRAIIHTGWVPQKQILGHKSVGCYVCHAGFSSVIEGIVSGCQLVLLPQKGDQFLNSKLLSQDLEVGVEVARRDEDGFFGKQDVYQAVKMVMIDCDQEPGLTIRTNHNTLKEFLMNHEIQEKYIVDLVAKLKDLALPNQQSKD